MKLEAQKRQTADVVFPVADELSAIEGRALYYHNAVASGVPLGLILQELYDSPNLTFGPTEREFFERLAFYGARRYAANFAADEDPRVSELVERADRISELRFDAISPFSRAPTASSWRPSIDRARPRGRYGIG